MKYILMMNTMKTGSAPFPGWSEQDVHAHIGFMIGLCKSLGEAGQLVAAEVLAAVIRRFRDFAAAEDAVQEAMLAAAVQWPRQGMPANPRGWLIQVASRRMTDFLRSEAARRRRESAVAMSPAEVTNHGALGN